MSNLLLLMQSGGAPTLFSAGTPAALLVPEEGITAPSNLVASWADQSGNGNNAAQATGSAQPAYDSTGSLLSGPVVVNSSTKYLTVTDAASMRPSGAWTVMVAAKRTSAAAYQCLLNPSGSAAWTNGWCGLSCLVDGTTLRAWVGSYASGAVDYALDTSWHIHEVAYHGDGTFSYLVDGVAAGAGTGTPSAGGDLAIGAGLLTAPSTFAYPWQGPIGPIVWCAPTNDATLRSKLRRAMARRTGIAVTS